MNHRMSGVIRVVVALLPLAFVPFLIHLIAGGDVGLGGGEKGLVWVLPCTLWSLRFGLSSLVLWRRGWPAWRATAWSAVVGLVGVLEAARMTGPPAPAAGLPALNLRQNMDWTERETVRRALERAGGVKKEAAELMGISQRALSYYP